MVYDPQNFRVEHADNGLRLIADTSSTPNVVGYAWFRRSPSSGEPFGPYSDEPLATTSGPTYLDTSVVEDMEYDYQCFGMLSEAPPEGGPPVASFTISPTNPTVGQAVTFDGSASQNAVSWSWDDAGSSTNPVPLGTFPLGSGPVMSFTFNGAGTKRPRLLVTNSSGVTHTSTQTLVVAAADSGPAPAPVASFTWSPTTPQVGQIVTFDGSASTGGVSYAWDDAGSLSSPQPFGTFQLGSNNITGVTGNTSFSGSGTKVPRLRVTSSTGATDTVMQQMTVAASTSPPPSGSNTLTGEPSRASLPTHKHRLYGYGGSSRPNGNEYSIPLGFRHGGNTGIEGKGLTVSNLTSGDGMSISAGATVTRRRFTNDHRPPANDITYVECQFESSGGVHCVRESNNRRATFIDCTFIQTGTAANADAFLSTSTNRTESTRILLLRCNLSGGGTTVRVHNYVWVLESFVHDQQSGDGHQDGTQVWRPHFRCQGSTVFSRYRQATYASNNESIWGRIDDCRWEDSFFAGGNAGLAIYWEGRNTFHSDTPFPGPGRRNTVQRCCFAKGSFGLFNGNAAWTIHEKSRGPGQSNLVAHMGPGSSGRANENHGSDWVWNHTWFHDGTPAPIQTDNNTFSWSGAGQTMPNWSSRTLYTGGL